MNLEARTIDPRSTARLEGARQSADPIARVDRKGQYSMTLPEIAADLGASLPDVVLLEQRAIIKAQVWAQKNGYRLEDLLGVRSRRTTSLEPQLR